MTDKYNRKCIYAGRRIGASGKVTQCFLLLPKKEEIYFKGVKQVWIGYTYKCGESSISGKPERTEDERIDNPEWDALDALVDAKNAERRADKKLQDKAKPALKTAIEAFRPLAHGLTYFDRRALIEHILEQVRIKK